MEKTKRLAMTVLIGDNIISALGFTSEENFQNVKSGKCGLRLHEGGFDLPEPFMASEIDNEAVESAFYKIEYRGDISEKAKKYTKLEKCAIVSVADALKNTNVNPADNRVLFIYSTTKGNVFLIDENESDGYEPEQVFLWRSAELIAEYFGNKNRPIVISNACISGATALIVAQRELRAGRYDHVIVVGADMLSKFIISGFQSFKALSQDVCKPFDAQRVGLNIGEAVATQIFTERSEDKLCKGDIRLVTGAIRNDANHISGPSRTGEGSFLALQNILSGIETNEIAFVNAHGTATPYNDEMESIALTRAGLQDVPVNSLKGYFGHTLGAAGVLESIMSVYALKNGTVLRTNGFEALGVTNPLNVVAKTQTTTKKYFIKMLSGFGGCNAALLYKMY